MFVIAAFFTFSFINPFILCPKKKDYAGEILIV